MYSKSKNSTVPDIYLNIGHLLDHFMMLIFAKAAYDSGRSFGLQYDEMILFGTLGMILFGATAPLAGILSDKYGRIPLMIIYHFGIGFSAIIASMSSSPIQLAISLGLIGLFASIYHPVGIAMLLQRSGLVGLRLGINGVWGNMGIAIAPVVTGVILYYGDWRLTFLIPGIVCVLFGILFFLNITQHENNDQNKSDKGNKQIGFTPRWQQALFALALSTASGGFLFGAMSFLLPRYFEINMLSLSTNVAITGILAGVVFACASFAQMAVGWLIDRISPRLVLFWIALGQVIFIYLASQFENLSLFFLSIAAMCFVFGQIPITDTILVRYVPDNWRSRVLSAKFLLNLCIGASVLPITSQLLKIGYDLKSVFIFASIIALGVVFSSILLPKQTKELNPNI
tara:strand:+ start:189 stop:1385 length:1197 start_codon:yes stop_codon:yes gene_type:complete